MVNMDYILIYTLQKCGTHLLSNICALMLEEKCNIYKKEEMYKVVPHFTGFRGATGFGKAFGMARIISTHPMYLGYENSGVQRAKILTSIRNPIDVCISNYFYNECRNNKTRGIRNIETYVSMNIVKICNDMLQHIRFIENDEKNDEKNKGEKDKKRLMIKYEDLVSSDDKKRIEVVEKIANFIGYECDEERCRGIVNKVRVEKAREHEQKRGMYKVGVGQIYAFHRDGSVGQWNKYLTVGLSNKLLQFIKIK